jgi:hypothetical protein
MNHAEMSKPCCKKDWSSCTRDAILGHQFEKKTQVFCSMLFTVSSTGSFKETHTLRWFKISLQKIRKTRKT